MTKELEKLFKEVAGKPLEAIIWADACERSVKVEELKEPADYLCPTISYGRIIQEDKYAITLAYNESIDEMDILTIPKKWLVARISLSSLNPS